MAEFLILPEAFIDYVATFKKIPVPPDMALEALRSVVETVTLEAWMGLAAGEPSPTDQAARSAK